MPKQTVYWSEKFRLETGAMQTEACHLYVHFICLLTLIVVEASPVTGTVNEVIFGPGLLVWVECCVGFMVGIFFVVCTSSSSLSARPGGNTRAHVLYQTTLLY